MLQMETRRDFLKVVDTAPIPDLIDTQMAAYVRFLQRDVDPERRKKRGLEGLLHEIFPIVSYDGQTTLEYLSYEFGEPRYSQDECRDLKLTYGVPLRIRCRLTRKGKKDVLEESIYLGDMPTMIGGGEFIVNGTERVIVSQLHRSPGVDFTVDMQESDRPLHGARIIPERGSWIELSVSKKDTLTVRIDQSSKIPATSFLRAMDKKYGTDAAIIREFFKTKTVAVAKLRPQMYLVEAFVDPESGEELVPAGGQIGEALTKIAMASPSKGGGKELCDLAIAWIENNLEFRCLECAELSDKEIDLLEERLMVEFPSSRNVADKKHLPRFNKKPPKKGPGAKTQKEVNGYKRWWDENVSDAVKEKFDDAVKASKYKTGWLKKSEDASAFKAKGIYLFRDRTTHSVADGYVGIASERKDKKGPYARIKMHYGDHSLTPGGQPNDSLQNSVVLGGLVQALPGSVKPTSKLDVVVKPGDPLLLNTLAEDAAESHDDALLRLYMRLRPGNPPQLEKARTLFQEKFYDENRYRLGKVGRFRANRKFKQDVPESVMTLRVEDFVNTLKYIMTLRAGDGTVDDIDHLGNRRLRTIDELAGEELRKGFLKLRRTAQERMSLKDPNELNKISEVINSKSVSSAIDFFFGRSELSQVVDHQNPLSQLTHERRLSALGAGGLNRKRAGFEVRDVHISHYGRICPIETPEGNNVGLISSLGIFAGVDEYGFLTTPYRKVERGKVTDEVHHLRADQEMEAVLVPPDSLERTSRGTERLPAEHVLARAKGEVSLVNGNDVDYVDISPKQIVGVSAALIPFLEHDDANRALMGSNMMRQAVPLIRSEAPIVATGMETSVARNSGMVVKARKGGVVTQVDATRIVIDNADEYVLRKFAKLNERACLNQKPIVHVGERVKKGQLLADGSGISNEQVALGRNLLVAFMPFDGYNFEDAILMSERLLKQDTFTSVHLEEYEVEIRETQLGREEFTRDIPNVSERALRNLDETGIVLVGTRVGSGDILAGKVVPKSKSELSPEEKLLHAIFGRAGEDVKNDSLELPAGEEGIVVETKRFSRRTHMSDDQRKAHNREVRRYRNDMNARQVKIFHTMAGEINTVLGTEMVDPSTRQKVGQSDSAEVILEQIENFTTRWIKGGTAAAKQQAEGIYNKYWPLIAEVQKEMARKLDHMKRGDELPSGVLEMVKVRVATKRKLGVGDKMAGRHGNKGVIAKILPEEDMPFLADGTPIDIVLNPLGVPGRMNVGQILETHLGWAAAVLGFQAVSPVFNGAGEDEIWDCIREANEHVKIRKQDLSVTQQAGDTRELLVEMPVDGKTVVYDGRTGEPFEQKVTVGYIYMNKLHHLVDEKIHARSTGPYSLITQQPLGGKARTGGQRFGEMEVWGLEAYGASYVLQELLTVKSDDVEGRTKIYESMVKGTNILEAGTPVSFDVLCSELKGLGLNVELEKKRLI